MKERENPFHPFIQSGQVCILDGGLATELEARGHDLNHTLWSARLLIEKPDAIQQLHSDYLKAGADCIISASYQASFPGFAQHGVDRRTGEGLLRLSVQLAQAARDDFWADEGNRNGRLRPLVAGSVGPYGAYLANGAEYSGDYGLDQEGLYLFHKARWQILADSGADLLAVETLPSLPELKALIKLLEGSPAIWAWFSFSCRDGAHICDSTPITTCLDLLHRVERVAAVGVNCTPPQLMPALLQKIRSHTRLPIIIYPNSGERYDADQNRWYGEREPTAYSELGAEWRRGGASIIGGCCRTHPTHIERLRKKLVAVE